MDQPPEHEEGQVRASAAVDQSGSDIPLARRRRGVNVIDFSDPLPFFSSLRPERKLLLMVFLLALKDRASTLRFEPCEPDSEGPLLRMFYEVEGVSHELVPPPRSCSDAILSDLRRIVAVHPARHRLARFLRRLAHGIDGEGDVTHSGRSHIQLKAGAHAVDVSVMMTASALGDHVFFRIPAYPTALRDSASNALRDFMALRRSRRMTDGS